MTGDWCKRAAEAEANGEPIYCTEEELRRLYRNEVERIKQFNLRESASAERYGFEPTLIPEPQPFRLEGNRLYGVELVVR